MKFSVSITIGSAPPAVMTLMQGDTTTVAEARAAKDFLFDTMSARLQVLYDEAVEKLEAMERKAEEKAKAPKAAAPPKPMERKQRAPLALVKKPAPAPPPPEAANASDGVQ